MTAVSSQATAEPLQLSGLDFRLDSLGLVSKNTHSHDHPYVNLRSTYGASQPPTRTPGFVSRELRRALDTATRLRSDRSKRPAPCSVDDDRSVDPSDSRSVRSIAEEERIRKAFDECLLQPGIAKVNPAKRRYFGGPTEGLDRSYESLDSDSDNTDNNDSIDQKVFNDLESLDSSNSSSSSSSCPPPLQSSPSSSFFPSPYLSRKHPYRLVEQQYLNRLRKRDHYPATSNRLPKGYREIPAPQSDSLPSTSQSSRSKNLETSSLSPPSWVILNVHHLRPSNQRCCQICFSTTHHTRVCPAQRCLCCGRESHSFRNCPESSKVCNICGFSGHNDESTCSTAMMERSIFKSSSNSVNDSMCCIRCGERGHYLCPYDDGDNTQKGLEKINALWNYCSHCGSDRHVFRMCRRRREFRALEGNCNRRTEYIPPVHTFAGNEITPTPREEPTSPRKRSSDRKVCNDPRQYVLSLDSDSSSTSEEELEYQRLSRQQKKTLKKQDRKAQKEKLRRKKKHKHGKSDEQESEHHECRDDHVDETPRSSSKSRRATDESPKMKNEKHSKRSRSSNHSQNNSQQHHHHHHHQHHEENTKRKKRRKNE